MDEQLIRSMLPALILMADIKNSPATISPDYITEKMRSAMDFYNRGDRCAYRMLDNPNTQKLNSYLQTWGHLSNLYSIEELDEIKVQSGLMSLEQLELNQKKRELHRNLENKITDVTNKIAGNKPTPF